MALSGIDQSKKDSKQSKNMLVSAYLESVKKDELKHDPAQEHVIHELQAIL